VVCCYSTGTWLAAGDGIACVLQVHRATLFRYLLMILFKVHGQGKQAVHRH
jgi:hypothetical protein